MTNDEKKKHMQDLAVAVYAAYEALQMIEGVAKQYGLNCNNKQNMWFSGSRDKVVPVLVNGEIK